MIRAGSAGFDKRQRAHSEMLAEGNKALDRGQRQAQMAGQLAEQGESRQLREAQFDKQMEDRAAGREQQKKQFESSQAQQKEIEAGRRKQAAEGMDLDAAKHGIERTPQESIGRGRDLNVQQTEQAGNLAPGEQGPPTAQQQQQGEQQQGPPQDPRLAALDAEMAKGQQNLRAQTSQPLEMPGSGREPFIGGQEQPQPAFRATEATKQQRQSKAENEKLKAQAYAQQTLTSAKRAQLAQDKEAYKAAASQAKMALGLDKMSSQLENFVNGEGDVDWKELGAAAKDVPDPSIRQAIANKGATPEDAQRVKQFMQSRMNKEAIKFIAELGDIPSDDEGVSMIDVTSPTFERFNALIPETAFELQMQPGLTDRISSIREKNRIVRKLAAVKLLSGQSGGLPEFGSLPQPSTGGTPPGAAQDPEAVGPTAPEPPPVSPEIQGMSDLSSSHPGVGQSWDAVK